jgi:SNF2 family DNA or RNA helicase
MAKRKFNPHPYQLIGMRHLIENERCALWAGMGMGKTVTTATVLNELYYQGFETQPTLILAPKRVALNTWPAEFEKWDHIDIECSPILGTEKERLAAMKRDVPVFTINYDNLPWLREQHKVWPYRIVVADESTRLKGFRTQQGTARAMALGRVVHQHVNRVIELTGTPAPNGLKDLWGQMYMLDAGKRLGRTHSAFMERWFQSVPGGDGYMTVKPLFFAQEQIQHAVKDICLTLDPKDYFDLKEPIVRDVYVDLPYQARRIYRDMEKEMFAQIEEHGVEAFNAGSRTNKCAQIANGAIYVDEEKNWSEIHDEKLDALESIIEEANGMPVLVAYEFKHDLKRLMKRFPRGKFLDDKRVTEIKWNQGVYPVMFAHPQSAGHGLNLQDGGNILVFFGHSWNLEYYQQILERIGPMRQLQSGHDRPVWVYHIIARDTVDEDMRLRRESKREVQDILLEAAKRRK